MSESGKPKDSVSASPETPIKRLKFSKLEPIVGILFAVVATVIFLRFSHIITITFIGGHLIPTFDADVIQSLWLPIIIWAILRIGINVAYLIERYYTQRLAVISVIGNVLSAIALFIIFFDDRIVHWEYVDFINRYFEEIAAWFGEIIARPNLIILAIMVIAMIIDSVTVTKKGLKAKRLEDEAEKRKAEAEESKPEEIETEAEAEESKPEEIEAEADK